MNWGHLEKKYRIVIEAATKPLSLNERGLVVIGRS